MTALRTGTRRGRRGDAVSTRDREQTFVEHYLATLNGRRAALAAGYSEASACQEAHRLLRKPNVRQQIDERRREAMAKLGTSREHLLAELACVSFFDVRRTMNDDGTWKKPHELDDATAAAIATVRYVERMDENGRTVVDPVYVPFNKNDATEKLAKHLGLYERDNRQRSAGPLAEFIAAMGQAGRMQPVFDVDSRVTQVDQTPTCEERLAPVGRIPVAKGPG